MSILQKESIQDNFESTCSYYHVGFGLAGVFNPCGLACMLMGGSWSINISGPSRAHSGTGMGTGTDSTTHHLQKSPIENVKQMRNG